MTLSSDSIGTPFKSPEFLQRDIPCAVAVDLGIADFKQRGCFVKGWAETCDSKGAVKVQVGERHVVTGLRALRRLK